MTRTAEQLEAAAAEGIVCPGCGKPDDLVVNGIDAFATLGRYADAESNNCRWTVRCFACHEPAGSINDAARDILCGTDWRDN